MKTEFITYDKLPKELEEIKNKAFSHSLFTAECEAMDELGSYTALFMNDKFFGAVNTISNKKPIELWSNKTITINEAYSFFCRGFVGEGLKGGLGASILLLLSIGVAIEKNNTTFYTSCRKQHKGVVKLLKSCGYKFIQDFESYHQEKPIELALFRYNATKEEAVKRKNELTNYLSNQLK